MKSGQVLGIATAAAMGLSVGIYGPAQASGLLGGSSVLSAYDQDLIRKPVKGSLKGKPRRPRIEPEENQQLGTRLDLYQPGLFEGFAVHSNSPYAPYARLVAQRYGVPVDIFMKLVKQESNWNPKAKSHKGAIGLAQLMPGTAKLLGVDPYDPKENLEGGARYLSQQYRKFRNWRLALAAYNAGPQAVARYNGVPPYKETQNYVRAILGN